MSVISHGLGYSGQMPPRLLRLGGAVTLLFVTVLAALAIYQHAYAERIFPGVSVGNQPVGGLTSVEAHQILQTHFDEMIAAPLRVQAGGKSWTLSRTSMGARYDVDALTASAYQVGRDGPTLRRLILPALLKVSPRNLGARAGLSDRDWNTVLQPIASALARPAINAKLVVGPDLTVRVVPERDGAALDLAEARRRVASALVNDTTSTVELPVVPVPPAVRAADLAGARSADALVLSAPVTIQFSGQTWELSRAAIQDGLILPDSAARGVRVDPAVLEAFVQRVAAAVDRPARDARLTLEGERVLLIPGQSGRRIEVSATVRRVEAALTSQRRQVDPVLTETPPAVSADDLRSAQDLASRLIAQPIVLRGPGGASTTLAPATLRAMLVLPAASTDQRDGKVLLDPAMLKARVADFSRKIDRPAINARFQRAADGSVWVIRSAASGYRVDQEKSLALIETAAAGGSDRAVALPIETVLPSISAADAAKVAGLELVADNETSYVGSIPPRKRNVELATSFLNGVVVAPGEVFSFDRELGPATLDRGFQVGYGIEAQGNGGVKTVPSVAGGICQVATTLFQPLFWAGYAIEERFPHAYFIDHYRSRGVPGLDTTVDPDTGLDFRFKNDTDRPMLIQTSTDGSNVHFAVYGVKPTWTVKVDPPVISNLVKTDRTLIVQDDPTMPRGQQVYTESAEEGFTVMIRRTVTDVAGKTRVLDLRSVYAPSHNVVMVGTKG